MKCPHCNTELVYGNELITYQTLVEKVQSIPANNHPIRYCPSTNCLLCRIVGFWDMDGDYHLTTTDPANVANAKMLTRRYHKLRIL